MSFICTFCCKVRYQLYAGETWIPDDYISASFWRGEESPICVKCAISRSRETFYSFDNVNQFVKAIGLIE